MLADEGALLDAGAADFFVEKTWPNARTVSGWVAIGAIEG